MTSRDQFIDFKKRYEVFVSLHHVEFINNFKQNYQRLSNSFQILTNLVEELDRKEAQEFNIFSILDRGHHEVLTHTPFLAELLNPKGSHGQDNLFLRLFLTQSLNFSENDACDPNWFVIKESEHVDLRVVNYFLRTAVFIENKIYTDAHSGQLSRYFKIWKEGVFQGNGAFVYLTPLGNMPGDYGFDDIGYPENPKDSILKELIRLSYRKDISGWLEKALPQIQAPKVYQTVKQYINLIKTL